MLLELFLFKYCCWTVSWDCILLPCSFFQTCTEMVMPMCTDGVSDMFEPQKWDLNARSEECYKLWGVRPRPSWIISMYGGKNIYSHSNIIFRWALFQLLEWNLPPVWVVSAESLPQVAKGSVSNTPAEYMMSVLCVALESKMVNLWWPKQPTLLSLSAWL